MSWCYIGGRAQSSFIVLAGNSTLPVTREGNVEGQIVLGNVKAFPSDNQGQISHLALTLNYKFTSLSLIEDKISESV